MNRRGLALIELLVAVALFGLGTASLLRLHLELRRSTDLSRQRSEAVRHAASDLEQLRWLSGTTGTTGNASIADRGPVPIDTASSPTRYTLERRVQTDTAGRLHSVATTVRWEDRQTTAHALTLGTALTAIDPALGAATLLNRTTPLSSATATSSPGTPERSLRIPAAARDLGDGRHAFKPRTDEALVWLFDSRSGEVIGRCDSVAGLPAESLNAGSLGTCKAMSGLLLAGHIRFATDRDTLTSTDAEQPASAAMGTLLRLGLTTTGHPSPAWECAQDGPVGVPPGTTARTSIAYHCVVQPVAPASGGVPRWSGRLDLVPQGWLLVGATGGNTGRFRICRYSADQDGNGRIDNPEHPASYSVVTTPLGNQNFLVIRAAARCPVDAGASHGVDDSTVAHQP
ncbi:type IV pilus modification PilV family protein [Sphaerotilus sp.]|uniref:type IV pilus modification PilV family protein n=1 Tax=Sphaerotilus sp. TaxID=2093942 RepID=UPI0025FC4A70|nr:prepilin-type N-terminal cleavage/methylation domain-containing protein [Sphaerotilus sp.]